MTSLHHNPFRKESFDNNKKLSDKKLFSNPSFLTKYVYHVWEKSKFTRGPGRQRCQGDAGVWEPRRGIRVKLITMPRKKERKSDKNKKKLNLASPLTKAAIDDKEKSLYQKQIGFLNEKLER